MMVLERNHGFIQDTRCVPQHPPSCPTAGLDLCLGTPDSHSELPESQHRLCTDSNVCYLFRIKAFSSQTLVPGSSRTSLLRRRLLRRDSQALAFYP